MNEQNNEYGAAEQSGTYDPTPNAGYQSGANDHPGQMVQRSHATNHTFGEETSRESNDDTREGKTEVERDGAVSIDPVGASQVEQERSPLSAEEHMERENRRKSEMEQVQREEAEAAEILRQKSAARHQLTARHNEERRVQDPLPREVDRVVPHYDASSGQMKPVHSTVERD